MADSHPHPHGHSQDHDHSHDDTHGHAPGPAHLWQATSENAEPPDAWKSSGVRVIPGGQLDTNTPQTPGMNRAAAVTAATNRCTEVVGWNSDDSTYHLTCGYASFTSPITLSVAPFHYLSPPTPHPLQLLFNHSTAPPSQNRRPPPRPPRVRDLRRARPRTHALGLVP